MNCRLLFAGLLFALAASAAAQTLPRVAIIEHYVLDARYADGHADRFPALVQEAVLPRADRVIE